MISLDGNYIDQLLPFSRSISVIMRDISSCRLDSEGWRYLIHYQSLDFLKIFCTLSDFMQIEECYTSPYCIIHLIIIPDRFIIRYQIAIVLIDF
jgi:hypothetical protein